MDTLIRERNGKEEIWYSEGYIKNQVEMAYNAGLHKGIKVEFHSLTPIDEDMVNDLLEEFNRRVKEEYQKSFSDGEVWRIS